MTHSEPLLDAVQPIRGTDLELSGTVRSVAGLVNLVHASGAKRSVLVHAFVSGGPVYANK